MVLSELPHCLHFMSFILDPGSYCAVLWTTIGSGRSMPSTLLAGRAGEVLVRHLPICSFSESFSTSNGLILLCRSGRHIEVSVFAFVQRQTSPWGMANRNSRLWWATCKYRLGLLSRRGHTIRNLAYYLVFYFAHRSFTFLFPWNASAFFNTVSPGIS